MSMTPSKLYSREHVLDMISAMHDLIDGSAEIYNKHNEAECGSIAVQELNSFPEPGLLKDVYSRGRISMESAADHLMVFADSITEPAKTLAPWTCVRGLLESSALAVWFLDPAIDARTRVARSFAFRYSGFIEQIKFFQADRAVAEINRAQQRIGKVEQDAVALGYKRLLTKNGDINGIALHMPSIIELVGTTLNREGEYRLLSGIAHGHHWAITKMGFRVSDEKLDGQPAFEKYLHPEVVFFGTDIAVTAYAKVLWHVWCLYGWDKKEIENLLDKIYDQLQYNAESRFWH